MSSAYIFAPLAFACSSSSSTTIPAPSPRTKPLLSLSNGIEHLSGSVDEVSAVSESNVDIPIGETAASHPPATMTSASPYWIVLNASPMLLVPDAHAVTTSILFPLRPNWIATLPAAILLIIIGTTNGLTRRGPFVRMVPYAFSSS